jgi:hypothetical protein
MEPWLAAVIPLGTMTTRTDRQTDDHRERFRRLGKPDLKFLFRQRFTSILLGIAGVALGFALGAATSTGSHQSSNRKR